MKVVILAGGKGERMAGRFPDTPKALLMIGDKTVLEHQLDALKQSGFRDFILCLGYKASRIQAFLETHPPGDCTIEYRVEKTPLGTGGCLASLGSIPGHDVIVLNGDMLLNLDFTPFLAFHRRRRAVATLVVQRVPNPEQGDRIVIERDRRVTKIETRPHGCTASEACWINAGIVALRRDALRYTSGEQPMNLETDILRRMVESGEDVYAWPTRSFIRDIGTPENYRQCVEEYERE